MKAVLGALLVTGIAVWWQLGQEGVDLPPVPEAPIPAGVPSSLWGAPWNLTSYKPVPKKQWKANVTDIAKLATLRTPLVLKSSPAVEWAMQPLEDVMSLHDTVNRTRRQAHNPVFVLRASTGKWRQGPGYYDRVLSRDQEEPYTISSSNVTVEEFFAGDNSPQEYLYFTVPLEDWQPPLAEKVVTGMAVQEDETIAPSFEDGAPLPWNEQVWGMFGMNLSDFAAALYDNVSHVQAKHPEPQASLWLSHTNVTAHWHYDCSHNWFVQLAGSKRVLLAPPSAAHNMSLFPSIHPSYHQSQHSPSVYGPLLSGSGVDAPADLIEASSAMRAVVLHPGDVLYIPPYWLHTVTALNMSLSLSIVSPSEEEMIYAKAYWLKVPFGAVTARRDKVMLVQGYLKALLDLVNVVPSPREFMRNLLQTRYQPFYGLPKNSTAYPSCSLGNSFKCFTGAGDEKRRADLVAAHGEQIALTAAVFVLTLQETPTLSGKPVDDAVLVTLLEDYVEELSVYAVGACNVARFLHACF